MNGGFYMDNTVNFNDILKKSFTDLAMFQKISFSQILVCMLIALAVAMFIFFIYKYTFRGVVYSHTFNVSIVMMCLITSLIILTISSNVILSLGMVGALSIVRFRTAVKDPMDIIFMFWAIAVGIATGGGIYSVAILGSLFIGLILAIMSKVKVKHNRYILIVHYRDEAKEKLNPVLDELKGKIKSKTVSKGTTEINVEISLKDDNTEFLNRISGISGVTDAALVSYNGEFAQ
jgi:uncharacterized membrane protein YhiD involved in acid resistance